MPPMEPFYKVVQVLKQEGKCRALPILPKKFVEKLAEREIWTITLTTVKKIYLFVIVQAKNKTRTKIKKLASGSA